MNPLPCSPFPERKFRPVCTVPSCVNVHQRVPTDSDLSSLIFETLSPFKALPKPLRNRFRSVFGSKNGPKIDQKSIKKRYLYSTSFFHRFFITFLSNEQTLEPLKCKKTPQFFNISAYSAYYELSYN